MIVELFLVGTLLIVSALNLIIYKKKSGSIKLIVGLFVCLLYFVFKYYHILKDYMWIYEIACILLIVFYSFVFIPKKVTKNITEYDFFELEKSYNDLKDDREKLRQRYLSTVSLIDEGIIFYENSIKDVILSDRAHEILGGKQACSLDDHALMINELDRDEYLKAIERCSKKTMTYEIKYRIKKDGRDSWFLEKGHYIGVESKKSIIAVVVPLDVKCFKGTSFFDVDSMYQEDQMYPILKNLLDLRKSFSFVYFELSNVSQINNKYGREIGSLMMNDYIKFIKNNYQKDINKIFRITGIRYAMIIDDYRTYDDFHKALTNNQSDIYTMKIQIAGIKDTICPNFGIVNLTGSKGANSMELVKLGEKLLEEAISSSRRSYSIFGE